jgi:AcrR family transcriptional regulator
MHYMTESTDPRPRSTRPGGRSARNRQAVLAAALDELNTYGYAGLSTARIAERAGVHRTTVHRRWPRLADLISEALIDSAAATVTVPDEGDIRADLEVLLRTIADLVGSEEARRTIRSLVSDTVRSEAIGTVVRRVWTTRFEVGQTVIERAVSRGELRTDIEPLTIFSTLIGPIYLRVLITDQPLDNQFLDDIITLTLDGTRTTELASM